MAYLTKNIHIASCASRSDRQSPALQLVCQRHRARDRYCYEYLPLKLILLAHPTKILGWPTWPTLQRPRPPCITGHNQLIAVAIIKLRPTQLEGGLTA